MKAVISLISSKKIIFVFTSTAIFLIFTVKKVSASAGGFIPRIPNPTRFESGEDIVNLAAQLVRPFFLIGFAVMLFVGAATYLTAGDNDNKVKSARNTIIAAIVGFALAVLAPTIMNFVSGLLGVQGGLSVL